MYTDNQQALFSLRCSF